MDVGVAPFVKPGHAVLEPVAKRVKSKDPVRDGQSDEENNL